MTLTELVEHVAEIEHLVASLGWDAGEIKVTARVSPDSGSEFVLIHKELGKASRIEISVP